MATKVINISKDNVYQWLCSTGYLLPRTEVELDRLEKLYPSGSTIVNESAIDPFAIINGTRQKRTLSISDVELLFDEQEQLKMAARKHTGLPEGIIKQIKRNQQQADNGSTDNS
ncbi:MAG TPA: hypothetical protein VFW07_15225 [Parafilimonas sp.]|nr:hypothetical protein [Parafilimonas sp.]